MATSRHPLTPRDAASSTTLRATVGGSVPSCVGSCPLVADLGAWHANSLGAAVYDTTTTKPRRAADGTVRLVRTVRWTIVDACRAADGSVRWVSGDYYPPTED